jgi:tRNA uridine 5-carboxymethylaminomethyl modification enzyme|tara:strand:- start:1541 stop:2056 length:516 start_codon:yes stop_codon:yes gene_type:complete
MFSSRVERRLSVRPENADVRLSAIGVSLGLVSFERAAVAKTRVQLVDRALIGLDLLKRTPHEWRVVGLLKSTPVARHGRHLSAVDMLAVSNVCPFDVVTAATRIVSARKENEEPHEIPSPHDASFQRAAEILRHVIEQDGSALESASTDCFYRPYLDRQARDVAEMNSEER